MNSTIIKPIPDKLLVASIFLAELVGFIIIQVWLFVLDEPKTNNLLFTGLLIIFITNLVHYKAASVRPAINTIGVGTVKWLRKIIQKK